jgi:hypothetical protein
MAAGTAGIGTTTIASADVSEAGASLFAKKARQARALARKMREASERMFKKENAKRARARSKKVREARESVFARIIPSTRRR